ncbi:MFS transporter [Flaviflexus salsibiostraticola]|uniref:MFS transporter n=1 Tax=Flaviflexus salsibiostraticola TaxID=1282737 RepID=A0A3Q8WU62_9ACTO|nr:MFS transporter [Flaviflexus salsibiostraticola]AZN29297.1 MFS transporter [Flaviflexus salsibiostraticola]
MSRSERVYSTLVTRSPKAAEAMPDEVRRNIPKNGMRQVVGNALQSSGDQIVNASTVLPWLFAVLGVPPSLTGVLVPIRESGSMLPQAFLTPLVLKVRHRKWVFVTGALIQSASVAFMAGTAALAEGLTAGVLIIIALAVFSLGRCLGSISSKDVQGRTIPKGERGQINGLATTASGIVAITLGLAIRAFGGEDLSPGQLAWMLAGGALLWALVAVVYAGITEPSEEGTTDSARAEESNDSPNWFAGMVALLRDDDVFRRFVLVRSLLLVSALSPPFIVTMSIQEGSNMLVGLGGFVIASGLAALIGGRIFGRFADRSSRRLMSVGAGLASAVIIAIVIAVSLPGFDGASWVGTAVFVVGYFLIRLTHTGVRVARKTYIVDMAEGDKRTTYTAVSNTAMGIILLIVGAISSAIAAVAIIWALLFLAAMGLIGVFAGGTLPDVSAKA